METRGSVSLGSRRRQSKSPNSLRRWPVRSESLSGMLVRSGTSFTCFSHSLIVEASSRSNMTATLFIVINFVLCSEMVMRFSLRAFDLWFRGNGQGPILQKGADKCAIYLQAAVVADEAFFLERIHKFTYPCAGGTNHLRESCLAYLQRVLRL